MLGKIIIAQQIIQNLPPEAQIVGVNPTMNCDPNANRSKPVNKKLIKFFPLYFLINIKQ
ncbi:MAG: hypothetical protein LBV42_01235 [Methanobrevibacter sp.]|jgi:hypothetical protein|nr:hypothetical protein [Methanobrevibacter sp.]